MLLPLCYGSFHRYREYCRVWSRINSINGFLLIWFIYLWGIQRRYYPDTRTNFLPYPPQEFLLAPKESQYKAAERAVLLLKVHGKVPPQVTETLSSRGWQDTIYNWSICPRLISPVMNHFPNRAPWVIFFLDCCPFLHDSHLLPPKYWTSSFHVYLWIRSTLT